MDLLSKQELTRSLLLPLRFCMNSLRAAFSLSSASRCDFLLPPFPFFFLPSFPLSFFLELEWSTVWSPLNSSLRVSKSNFAPTCVLSASEAFFTSVSGSGCLSLYGVFFWSSCFSLSFPLDADFEPALADGLPLPELPVVLRMTNRERPSKYLVLCFLKLPFCQDVSSVSGRWMWCSNASVGWRSYACQNPVSSSLTSSLWSCISLVTPFLRPSPTFAQAAGRWPQEWPQREPGKEIAH